MNRLDFMIDYLLSERDDLGRIEIPEAEQDKFRLYRSLVNIRPAVKASDDYFAGRGRVPHGSDREQGYHRYIGFNARGGRHLSLARRYYHA